jgi:DNA-binding NarL/FixJ family response regulator
MTKRSRIRIAEDHTLVAELCGMLLETEFDVVGTVSHGLALIRAANELKPDVIVVDIGMPLRNGLDAGRKVKEMLPAVKVGLPAHESRRRRGRASIRPWRLELPGSGYLVKTRASEELKPAVRQVLRGSTYLWRVL